MTRRRGRGEGSIRHRPDGRWEATIEVGWQNGKRKRRWLYGPTRRDVQELLAAAQQEQKDGLQAIGVNVTVGQFLQQWLDSSRAGLRPKTLTSYEGTVRLHIVPTLGRVALRKLSPPQVQDLLRAKTAAGLSPRTVRYVLLVLRIALGKGVKWSLVTRNVAALVDAPRVPYRATFFLGPDEARRFLEVTADDRLAALYTVALSLGLRRGEALGLRWSDIDLEAGRLTVSAALQRIKGQGPQLVETKTARSRRTIALPAMSIAALRQHYVRELEERAVAGSRWVETGFVFTTRHGRPLDGDNVTRDFQRLLERCGLPRLRFHDLRHSAASLLLAQGVPPRVVMDVLGHSQIGVTMNLYTKVIPVLLDDAAKAMDRALGGQSGGQAVAESGE
jgi:integrase